MPRHKNPIHTPVRVGNLGHVIAEPAFVQAEHAAAGGRDDALVVASS